MTYMKEVAHMLGVELGERFKVSGSEETVYLDEDGLKAVGKEWGIFNNVLMCLVTGKNETIKLPWKPTEGTLFYSTGVDGRIRLDNFVPSRRVDLLMYKAGMVHRTEEEAEAHKEEDRVFWDEIRKELEG